MKKLIIKFALLFSLLTFAGCATTDGIPYVPPDLPTEQELANLLGEWEGLTETTTGLLDLLHLDFFKHDQYIKVSVYLNNTYVDQIFVEYDGDHVFFYSSNITGDYSEFDGYINHEDLVFAGNFLVQVGLSQRTGTFELYKL